MSYDPSALLPSFPVANLTGTSQIPISDGAGNLSGATMTALLAWLSGQGQDVSAMATGTALAGGDQVVVLRGGVLTALPATLFQGSGGTAASAATTFAVSLSGASGAVGAATTMTVTPGSGGWPSNVTVSPSASGVSGTFSPASATPAGMATASFNFTSSAAGTGTLSATAIGMTSGGGQTYTAIAPSGTAPSQVGSLAAGLPTNTSIPATYTAATGTATITYAGQTSPHGANTWTGNGGSFLATGGTFTGLAAATSYDLRIVATNSAGSSTTSLTAGVSTAAASQYPSLVFSGVTPAFETASPLTGAASLKITSATNVGSASAGITLPDNGSGSGQTTFSVVFRFRGTGSVSAPEGNEFLTVAGSQGNQITLGFSGKTFRGHAPGTSYSYSSTNIRDGNLHTFRLTCAENYNTCYWGIQLDGADNVGAATSPIILSGAGTLRLNFANLLPGDVIDDLQVFSATDYNTVPPRPPVRGASTLLLCTFDNQDGFGS